MIFVLALLGVAVIGCLIAYLQAQEITDHDHEDDQVENWNWPKPTEPDEPFRPPGDEEYTKIWFP